MDNDGSNVRQIRKEPLTVARVKTPQETRDLAYQLWAFAHARSWKLTAQVIGCDDSTLRDWAIKDGWEQRRRDDLASSVPGMVEETAIGLTVAAYHANMRLQQIAYEAAHDGVRPDTKEVQALTLIVDRAGYSPTGSNRPTLPDMGAGKDTLEPAKVDTLSVSDLIERERQRRQRRSRAE